VAAQTELTPACLRPVTCAVAAQVPGCSTCEKKAKATVCTGCGAGYVWKSKAGPGNGGLCGECFTALSLSYSQGHCSDCFLIVLLCPNGLLKAGSRGIDRCLCCAERPACKKYPCKNGKGTATCKPKAGAPKGRTCTCNAGFVYKNDNSGCLGEQAQHIPAGTVTAQMCNAGLAACMIGRCVTINNIVTCTQRHCLSLILHLIPQMPMRASATPATMQPGL
jgi:hypothetical protein